MSVEQARALDFFDAVESIELDEKRRWTLYNVLPAMVQSRIPALPSLRRAFSEIRSRSTPLETPRDTTPEAPRPSTPPPDYTSRPTSLVSSHRSNRNSFAFPEDYDPFQEALVERPPSSMGAAPPFAVSEGRTGIKWKYANQGVSLTTQAYAESQVPTPDETSTVLTRQMYIHGMAYLLRGLPSQLSPEETLSLQAALPENLVISAPCNHTLEAFSKDASSQRALPSTHSNPSILHRITAIIVFETFLLLQFLLPYLRIFLAQVYRFERKHNVTQKLVNNGLMTANALRRTGLQLSHTICQMNNGKVGQALNDLTIWIVCGITGGLQQGIQDGVSMMAR